MYIYEVSYTADWEDNCKGHTHDKMLLTFFAIAYNKEDALNSVIETNGHLCSDKFFIEDVEEITEGYSFLANNESFDM